MLEAVGHDLRVYCRLRYAAHPAPGLSRRAWVALSSPGWWQLAVHRAAYASQMRRRRTNARWRARFVSAALWPVSVVLKLLTKNEFHELTAFDAGVYLSNKGGLILGVRHVGGGTVIHHNVTIGMNVASGGMPEIGRDVWVGHDCVVHGEISIGDGVTILPGSVLTRSVPPGVVVDGNPARIVRRTFDNRALRASLIEDPILPVEDAPRRMEPVHAG
jgi:serine acetyltransferase